MYLYGNSKQYDYWFFLFLVIFHFSVTKWKLDIYLCLNCMFDSFDLWKGFVLFFSLSLLLQLALCQKFVALVHQNHVFVSGPWEQVLHFDTENDAKTSSKVEYASYLKWKRISSSSKAAAPKFHFAIQHF